MLKVTLEDADNAVILRCFGNIVGGEETAILCAIAGNHGRNIMLDLNQVDEIDATGIRLLIALQAAGFYLKLLNPSQRVREILRVTRLDSILEICNSESGDDRTEKPAADFLSEATTRRPTAGVPCLVTC